MSIRSTAVRQRLLYPVPEGHPTTVTGSAWTRRAFQRSGRVALAAALLLGAIATLPVVAAGTGAAAVHEYAAFDTGRMNIVVASAHPTVELFQDANTAVSAALTATQVVELAPSEHG